MLVKEKLNAKHGVLSPHSPKSRDMTHPSHFYIMIKTKHVLLKCELLYVMPNGSKARQSKITISEDTFG